MSRKKIEYIGLLCSLAKEDCLTQIKTKICTASFYISNEQKHYQQPTKLGRSFMKNKSNQNRNSEATASGSQAKKKKKVVNYLYFIIVGFWWSEIPLSASFCLQSLLMDTHKRRADNIHACRPAPLSILMYIPQVHQTLCIIFCNLQSGRMVILEWTCLLLPTYNPLKCVYFESNLERLPHFLISTQLRGEAASLCPLIMKLNFMFC